MVNLFLLAADPRDAVMMYCDAHVVKILVESGQILATILKYWGLWDETNAKLEGRIWKPAYKEHPVMFWAQASLNSATLVVRYAQCLVDEYRRRYGKEHAATAIIVTCCGVIVDLAMNAESMAPDDPERIRPMYLNKTDLVAAARAMYGDAYAARLEPKVFEFACSADTATFDRGYYQAAVCCFSLSVPGRTKAFNKKLTADLYAAGAHMRLTIDEETNGNMSILANVAGLMHCIYYACKTYIGFGVQRKPMAWWGEVGRIPTVVSKFFGLILRRVFGPSELLPCYTGPARRLPTTKCLVFNPENPEPRAEMSAAFPDFEDHDNEEEEQEQEEEPDVENATPSSHNRKRAAPQRSEGAAAA